jgi:hypothetical protein
MFKHHNIKIYGETEALLQLLLNSADGSVSFTSGRFTPLTEQSLQPVGCRFFFLVCLSTLNIEVTWSSETSFNFQLTARRCIQEDKIHLLRAVSRVIRQSSAKFNSDAMFCAHYEYTDTGEGANGKLLHKIRA